MGSTDNTHALEPTLERGLSRRRILQGAAWATPVILIATAVPAAAASGTQPAVMLDFTAAQLGNSDNWNLTFAVTLLPSSPAGSYLATGFTVVITVPSAAARFLTLNVNAGTWVTTPAVGSTGAMVVLTYTGANLTIPAPVGATLKFKGPGNGTATATVSGSTNAGTLSPSVSKGATIGTNATGPGKSANGAGAGAGVSP